MKLTFTLVKENPEVLYFERSQYIHCECSVKLNIGDVLLKTNR